MFFTTNNDVNGVYPEPVTRDNFQRANLYNTVFEASVSDCIFTNAELSGAVFKGPVTGLTIFSGANVSETRFEKALDAEVIFIGSNVTDSTTRPNGGIQTVAQLIAILESGEMSIEKAHTLYTLLTKAHHDIQQRYQEMQTAGVEALYHINDTHIDHLNNAVVELATFLATPSNGTGPS